MSNNMDNRLRKVFREESVEPPAYLWENIRKEVDARRRQKKSVVWWYSTAAGIVLLLGLSWLIQKKEPLEKVVSYTEITALGQDYIEKEYKNRELVSCLSARRPLPTEHLPQTLLPKKTTETPLEIVQLFAERTLSTPVPEAEIKTPAIRRDFIPLVNKNSYETQKLYRQLLLADSGTKPEKMKQSPGISLGGYIAPGYSSGNYTAPDKAARNYRYSGNQMQGMFNLSGGLKVAVNTGKRLSIQTGIMYTKIGQKTEGEKNTSVYNLNMTAIAGPRQVRNIPSLLGNIKTTKKLPSVYYATTFSSSGGGNIEQVFEALEIPLALKYRLNNNKLKISVLGGFSGSFIVANKAYLNYGNNRKYVGTTEDIRTFNISTDWALGVEYPIFPRITFMVEPGFRYYLQSISKNKDIDFKPYMFSFSTGIGISF